MSPAEISLSAFVCILGGLFLGMLFRVKLPEHKLEADSETVIRLGMALIATMSALVLALLINSAKTSFETQNQRVIVIGAGFLQLDRVLANYGPETHDARGSLRDLLSAVVEDVWSIGKNSDEKRKLNYRATIAGVENFAASIRQLQPRDDIQRSLFDQTMQLSAELGRNRTLLLAQNGETIPTAFLVVLIFWVTILFASFGISAPFNAIVMEFMLVCALSVAGAIYLVLQMDRPFEGLIQVSSAPLINVLTLMGK